MIDLPLKQAERPIYAFAVDKVNKMAYNGKKYIERQCGRNPLSIRLLVLTTD